MTVDGWNHNTHYHDRLLDAVPRPCRRALDVGCGLGGFARRLAAVADQVDAVDLDAEVVGRARERSPGIPNVHWIVGDFTTWAADAAYDFVSMVATLHHLPFAGTLRKAEGLLRPGGVIAVLGLDRASSWVAAGARSALAFPVSGYYRLTRRSSGVGASIHEPRMTLGEIAREAAQVLPGATIRRHLLWRYSLVWVKPGAPGRPVAPR